MADINEALRHAVTSRPETTTAMPGASTERKRARDDGGTSHGPTRPPGGPAPLKPAAGLDFAALQHDMASERERQGERIRRSYHTASQLSEEAASRMVHQLMTYVMQEQLGGRHNAVTPSRAASARSEAPSTSLALDIAVERASLRAIAALDVVYVCSGGLAAGEPCVALRKEAPAAEAVVAHRKLLRPCHRNMDLVGGVTAGLAPHSRRHWQRSVEAALRGDVPGDENADFATISRDTASKSEEEGVATSIDLFADSHDSAHNNAPRESDVAADTSLFSVDAFLKETTSSSDGDEAE